MALITSDQFAAVLLKALGLPISAMNAVGKITIDLLPGQPPRVVMQWFVRDEPEAEALAEACKDARIVVESIDYRTLMRTEAAPHDDKG